MSVSRVSRVGGAKRVRPGFVETPTGSQVKQAPHVTTVSRSAPTISNTVVTTSRMAPNVVAPVAVPVRTRYKRLLRK